MVNYTIDLDKVMDIAEDLHDTILSMKYPTGKTVIMLEAILKDVAALLPSGNETSHKIWHYFQDKYMPKIEGYTLDREI